MAINPAFLVNRPEPERKTVVHMDKRASTEPERKTVVHMDKRASTEPERKTVVLTDKRASTEPTVVLTNTDFADILLRAAVRDLDDFLKRYADLRQHQPMLESVFEKIEEAVRRLRADRP